MITYTNISGTAATEIIPKTNGDGRLSSISIANTHNDSFSVRVYLNTGSTIYFIIKDTVLPPNTTLVLDDDNVFFNKTDVGLWVALGAAGSGTSEATVITKIKERKQ